MRIPSGSTDRKIYFVALDATDLKTRETGLSSWTVYRSRNGAAEVAYTTPTITEIGTNMPGVYALTLDEDTTLSAGHDSEEYCVHITHTGMAPVTRVVELYRTADAEGFARGMGPVRFRGNLVAFADQNSFSIQSNSTYAAAENADAYKDHWALLRSATGEESIRRITTSSFDDPVVTIDVESNFDFTIDADDEIVILAPSTPVVDSTNIQNASDQIVTINNTLPTIVLALEGLVLHSGSVGATGNDTTHVNLTGLTHVDDGLNDYLLVIFENTTGERHSRWIEDWVAATDLATVETLSFTPDVNDIFWLLSIKRSPSGTQLTTLLANSSNAAANSADALTNTSQIITDLTNLSITLDSATIQELAEGILKQGISGIESAAAEHSLATLILACLEWQISGSTWTIKRTDGTTVHITKTLASVASPEGVTSVT